MREPKNLYGQSAHDPYSAVNNPNETVQQQQQSPEPDALDYAADVGKGVVNGAVGTFQNVGKVADSISEALGYDLIDDSYFKPLFQTKTWAGDLSKSITEFALTFLPVAGAVSKIGWLAKGGKLAQYAGQVAAGGLTDALTYKEGDVRLADIIQNHTGLEMPVLSYLASNPDDSWAEARLKAAVEGMGLGLAADSLVGGLRALKAKNVVDRGAADALLKNKLEDISKAAEEATTKAEAGQAVSELNSQRTYIKATSGASTEEIPVQANLENATGDKALAAAQTVNDKLGENAVTREQLDTTTSVTNVKTQTQTVVDRVTKYLPDPTIFTPSRLTNLTEEERGTVISALDKAVNDGVDVATLLDGLHDQWLNVDHVPPDQLLKVQMHLLDGVLEQRGVIGMTETRASQMERALSTWSDSLDRDPAKLHMALAAMGAAAQQMTAFLYLGKAAVVSATRDAQTFAWKVLTKDATVDDLAQLWDRMDYIASLQGHLHEITSGAARTTNMGNADVTEETLKALGNVVGGAVDREVGKVGQEVTENITRNTTTDTTKTVVKDRAASMKVDEAVVQLQRMVKVDQFSSDALGQMRKVLSNIRNWRVEDQYKIAHMVALMDSEQQMDRMLIDLGQYGKTAQRVAQEIWYNSLLSALKTPVMSTMSGAFRTVLQPAERFAGGLLTGNTDAMQSAVRLYGGVAAVAQDIWNQARIAGKIGSAPIFSDVVNVWKEQPSLWSRMGTSVEDASVRAISPQMFPGMDPMSMAGKALDWLGYTMSIPTKLLQTTDAGIIGLNLRTYVRDLAMQRGLAQKLDGDSLAQYVANWTSDFFSAEGRRTYAKEWTEALNYAQAANFTQPLTGLFRDAQVLMNDHPILKMAINPFVRTPMNILKTTMEMTPGMGLLFSDFRRKLLQGDPQEKADAVGRLAMGSMFWVLGMSLASKGRVTGGGPKNTELRNQMRDTGWQPYSIVFDNGDGTKSYMSYNRLDVLGSLLGMAADYHEAAAHMNPAEADGVAMAMGAALARNLTNKTYVVGLANFANALADPDTGTKKWLQQFASSWVPNILGVVQDDPYMRDTRSMLDAIRRRIPGYSEQLPPTRNILGEPVLAPGGWLPGINEDGDPSALIRNASPLAFSKSAPDALKEELANLRFGFSSPAKSFKGVDLTQVFDQNGRDAHDYMQQRTGEVRVGGRTLQDNLERLIASKNYQSLPMPEQDQDSSNARVRAILKVIADHREAAMRDTLRQYPQIGDGIRAWEREQRQTAFAALRGL